MSNRNFYQETFSQVRGSRDIRWEDYQMMRRRAAGKRLAVIAVAAALAAALESLREAFPVLGPYPYAPAENGDLDPQRRLAGL